MRKGIIAVLAVAAMLVPALDARAENLQTSDDKPIYLSSKVPIALYGFISAETAYSSAQLSSFGTLDNTPANYNRNIIGFNRVVDKTTSTNNRAFLGWTVQNTRFGLLLSPYNFKDQKFEIDARLEMDFANLADTTVGSAKPRIRRAYAAIGHQGIWRFLFGQEWDVYSPLNPGTLNISGNLWQQGNVGYRHPQILFSYLFKIDDDNRLEAVASAGLPSNSILTDDAGATTCIPQFQGRFGYLRKLPAGDLKIYLSGAYAKHNNSSPTAARVNNWGIALSSEIPIHKFAIPAFEVHYGYSLGNMFTLASDTMRQRDIAAWGQIKSKWLKWLETNVGYGIDTLDSAQVATGWVSRNQVGFFNAQFKPIDAFVIGLEYNHLRTNYQGQGPSSANVALLNVMYIF